MIFRSTVVILLAVIISACASAPRGSSETRVELDDAGRIVYAGSITDAANARAMGIYARAEVKPTTFVISSPGGSIKAGLDLGEWILDNGLAVEVDHLCASSCANYVFVAGREKRLQRHSVLLWHGSAWQRSFDRFADPSHPDYSRDLAEWREREVAFFDRIGVDNLITVHGQLIRLPLTAYLRALIRRPLQGYDYDLEDMRRMGVTGIVLVDGEWDWRRYSTLSVPVRRVSLGDDYEFTPSRFQGESSIRGNNGDL